MLKNCGRCGKEYDDHTEAHFCSALIQSTPKTENNYYETKIGDAIDEPAPVNPIPDRQAELYGDQTIDIEEYLMTTEPEHDFDQDTDQNTETVFPEPQGPGDDKDSPSFRELGDEDSTESNDDIDEQNSDLERRERLEGVELDEDQDRANEDGND